MTPQRPGPADQRPRTARPARRRRGTTATSQTPCRASAPASWATAAQRPPVHTEVQICVKVREAAALRQPLHGHKLPCAARRAATTNTDAIAALALRRIVVVPREQRARARECAVNALVQVVIKGVAPQLLPRRLRSASALSPPSPRQHTVRSPSSVTRQCYRARGDVLEEAGPDGARVANQHGRPRPVARQRVLRHAVVVPAAAQRECAGTGAASAVCPGSAHHATLKTWNTSKPRSAQRRRATSIPRMMRCMRDRYR
jgi:hypothetical protein